MERKSAYSGLARQFEYLNDDCGYEKWSQYLIARLKEYPLRSGLDIGCGGGRFTREFYKAGYCMTGMDISSEMLSCAEENSLKEGLKIPYLMGDISAFRSPEKFDFATAINDCVNYLPEKKLLPAFKNVYSLLNKGGIFLFDISTRRKFFDKIANTVCADDRDDVTYLCFNSLKDDTVTMDVTLFVRRTDGAFDRFDETHTQYIYDEGEILSALKAAKFEILLTEGLYGEDKASCDRLVFFARKI